MSGEIRHDGSGNGRRLADRLISSGIGMKYRFTERRMLDCARLEHQHEYAPTDDDPLVSIIIATYNRGQLLVERTLPSIFAQTYQNFEVVIVGDNCPDNTPELMAQVDDPRVRFHNLAKRGTYPSDITSRWFVQGVVPRNKGMELARGKWFGWISDDDLLLPNHIESLLRFAEQGNFEFVSAAYIVERHGEKTNVDVPDMTPRIGGMQTWLYRSYLRLFEWNVQSWRKSWNRPCDYDLQWRMVDAGVRTGFLDEVVAYVPPMEGTDTVGLEAQRVLAEKENNQVKQHSV